MNASSGTRWALIVHGGAPRAVVAYTREEQAARRQAIDTALNAGRAILVSGGSGVEAVRIAVRVLEDAPVFNAGRGSALTHEGHAELDASIMDGQGRRVGAVAGLRHIRNPVDLAHRLMEHSEHVFLIGEGAEQFAVEQGIELIHPSYFVTPRQAAALKEATTTECTSLSGSGEKSGTVGAVALDVRGNLAAATSTGGITNKRHGRVGDSPVIGAGTFAENGSCAVSATGWGEYFIRNVAAYDVCARIKYANETLERASAHVIEQVAQMGGYGGLIAVDAKGKLAMPFCTPTMPHGYAVPGELQVRAFGYA